MSADNFHSSVLELMRRASAFLPNDVTEVLDAHRAAEQAGSRADLALELVMANIGLAKRQSALIRKPGTWASDIFLLKRGSMLTELLA